jgi:hypothetical protein
MNWKNGFVAILLVVCLFTIKRCGGLVRANRRVGLKSSPAAFTKLVAGYKLQLVAIGDAGSGDHPNGVGNAWTPDGFPLEQLASGFTTGNSSRTLKGGWHRLLFFTAQQPATEIKIPAKPGNQTFIDAFAFLPQNRVPNERSDEDPGSMGPIKLSFWVGAPQVPGGPAFSVGSAAAMALGVTNTRSQPVAFGIAKDKFKVTVTGTASVVGIGEGSTETIASGPWGKIEATHMRHPDAESAPSQSHRFRLLGGPYPPITERRVYFYDVKGKVIATCGDGQNNSGYCGFYFTTAGGPGDITHFEIVERPYEYVQFDEVNFDPPEFPASKERL